MEEWRNGEMEERRDGRDGRWPSLANPRKGGRLDGAVTVEVESASCANARSPRNFSGKHCEKCGCKNGQRALTETVASPELLTIRLPSWHFRARQKFTNTYGNAANAPRRADQWRNERHAR